MKKLNRGFGPIAIIVIIALGLVVGGGVYKASKVKNENKNLNATTTVDVKSNMGNKGTIRDFLSFGKKVSCTFTQTTPAGTTSGTVYINNPKMRGDFALNGSTGNINSHMIRLNNDVYVWMGAQGAKMNISNINKATTTPAQSGQVNLDQKVDYTCMDWDGDESKFTLPTDVKFYDMSQMMQGKGMMGANANVNSNVNAGANACSACNSLPAGVAKDQCKAALNCK